MSIPNIIDKIKSKSGIDKNTFMFLLIIVGVGISSFGLGRMSNYNAVNNNSTSIESDDALMGDINSIDIINEENLISPNKEKRYVASKNGKMYYTLGCSGASRIKPENQIWFSTSLEAEKSGFAQSTTCK